MRLKIDLNTAVNHPLVRETLEEAARELNLSKEPQPIHLGGHGVVYRCHSRNGQELLLKVPSYGGRSADEHWILRGFIRKEATILGRMRCPALPKLIFAHAEDRFLAREFISGERLSKRAPATLHVPSKRLLPALLRTAAILFKSFHEEERYVIRDFKANNIIVPDDNNYRLLKLVDLDSARPESSMLSENPDRERLGSGKWRHWSPEQLLEREEWLDYRTDYFSLGVTAFTLITGDAPYSNLTREPELVMEKYLKEYQLIQRRLAQVKASLKIPEEIIEFTLSCLHPLPHARPQTFEIEPLLSDHRFCYS